MSLEELLTPAEMAEFHLDGDIPMRRRGSSFDEEHFSDAQNGATADDYLNPVPVVCEAIVERVINGARMKDILTRPDYVVILTVREPKWISYLKDAWLTATGTVEDGNWRGPDSHQGKRVGVAVVTERLEERSHNRDARKALARSAVSGIPCLVFTVWPKGDHLSGDITMLADIEAYVQPTAADVKAAYQQMGGTDEEGGVVSEELAQKLTPWSVAASYRAGMSADRWIDRLERVTACQADTMARERAAEAENKISNARPKNLRRVEYVELDGVPPLEERAGMGGFSEWGADLKKDLEAYRAGKLAWNMVDTGILLSGPPGVGKTSAVKSLAVSLGVKLVAGSYSIWLGSGSDGHQGTLLAAMRQTFAAARESGEPTILFIDEIDSFGSRQKTGSTDEHHRNWLAGSIGGLLQEIDGVAGKGKIILIGATNQPDEIDPAILRAGRLDKHVQIPAPRAEGLAQIMRSYLGAECPDADLLVLGHEMAGSTGADVEQVVRNARRIARKHSRALRAEDLFLAVRGTDSRTPGELFADAVHEAAHAFLSEHLVPGSVLSATVRATDHQLGGVAMAGLPNCSSETQIREKIRVLLAGRAADEVINQCIDSGAVSDLEMSTLLATQCVLTYGFLKKEAGMRFRGKLGGPNDLRVALRDNPEAAEVVENILATEYDKAVLAMKIHAKTVVDLAAKLVKSKTLTGDQIRLSIKASSQSLSKKPQTPMGHKTGETPDGYTPEQWARAVRLVNSI